jgi:hypothetical protein
MSAHPNHPGDGVNCEIRVAVSERRTDGAGGGYACAWTGGHCVPGWMCEERRAAYEARDLMEMDL